MTHFYNSTDKIIPHPVTFSTEFGNFSYWQGPNGDSYNFIGLGLTTKIMTEYPGHLRYPYFWTHIEDHNTRLQGYNILRIGTYAGDNVYRLCRNGVSYLSIIKSALGVAEDKDIVGVVYFPMTDRLNT